MKRPVIYRLLIFSWWTNPSTRCTKVYPIAQIFDKDFSAFPENLKSDPHIANRSSRVGDNSEQDGSRVPAGTTATRTIPRMDSRISGGSAITRY